MYRPRIPLSETGANKALRAIGVQVTDLDEFQSLGLQKYRHTDAWVEIEKSTL